MATTLADLATNSGDKLVQGFINEIITDSYLLGAMTFDDCMTPNGTSDMVYGYKRIKTPMSAAFRSLNEEPTTSQVTFEKVTTNVGILSASFPMDRVARDAANDVYEANLEDEKNSIIRAFNKQVVGGDKDTETKAFDGLAKAVKGSSTEYTSAVDLATITQTSALAFTTEMDTLLSSLMRTPDVLLVSPAMHVRINAIMRVLGLGTQTMETAGRPVQTYDNIPIQEMRDGCITNNDVYAACLGMDGFHGITLKGGSAITVSLPDWSAPGAVKNTEAEFVCGCALKATKAAGVLHQKAAA